MRGEEPYCPRCDEYFDRRSFRKHTDAPHWQCPKCDKQMLDTFRETHEFDCGNPNPHRCDKCRRAFKRHHHLVRHSEADHIQCPNCLEYYLKRDEKHHQNNCEAIRHPPQRFHTPEDLHNSHDPSFNDPFTPGPSAIDTATSIDLSLAPTHANTAESYESFREDYTRKASAILQRAVDNLGSQVIEKSRPGKRAFDDGHEMRAIMEFTSVGRPVRACEAPSVLDGPTNLFVLEPDPAEVRKLLEDCRPPLAVLVPDGTSLPSIVAWEQRIPMIAARGNVDVHDFECAAEQRHPVKMTVEKALKLVDKPGGGRGLPLNFLSLRQLKDNPVPTALANIQSYKMITAFGEKNGKEEIRSEYCDLDNSQVFQLYATQNANHLPHVDRHGVITTIHNEEGEKIWLIWTGLSDEQLV